MMDLVFLDFAKFLRKRAECMLREDHLDIAPRHMKLIATAIEDYVHEKQSDANRAFQKERHCNERF